jgi:hypothetical protein
MSLKSDRCFARRVEDVTRLTPQSFTKMQRDKVCREISDSNTSTLARGASTTSAPSRGDLFAVRRLRQRRHAELPIRYSPIRRVPKILDWHPTRSSLKVLLRQFSSSQPPPCCRRLAGPTPQTTSNLVAHPRRRLPRCWFECFSMLQGFGFASAHAMQGR